MKHCCMIFLLLEIIAYASCTSQKRSIAHLFHYRIYHNDGPPLDSSKSESRADLVNTKKQPSYNSVMKNLPMYSSYELSSPIKYEDPQQESYNIPTNYYIDKNEEENNLDLLKSNYFDNKLDDDFYHRLSRKKRRIIYLNDKFDPLNYTPKRHVKKDIKETETFEDLDNKIDNNQGKSYQVYDTESDVNSVKPNHLWSYVPINKMINGETKGHGYLIFGKRYSFYVSIDPNMKNSKSSSTSVTKLVVPEDDLKQENTDYNDQKDEKENIQAL